MITEDYVSFETSKLLKEKGFNADIDLWYDSDGEIFHLYHYDYNATKHFTCVQCPTLQMAMKWLREVHNRIIIPGIRVTDPITGIIDCYCVGIHYIPENNGGALCFISPTPEEGYSTYEEACEEGIKYCLRNLL